MTVTEHVKLFRDTSPYVNMHRAKTFVLVLHSEAIDHENFGHILGDIALINNLGIRIVLVHGAKAQIDAQLHAQNLTPHFHKLLRITDNAAMTCVLNAVGSNRIAIESVLSTNPANSPGTSVRNRVSSGNFITAKPSGIRDGVDFLHTGEVRKVDSDSIQRLLDDGDIVLVSPLGYSPTGEVFNLSCEDVATQLAITLQADKLIIMGSAPGILNKEGKLQKVISLPDISHWQDALANENPALANSLQAAYDACLSGVERSHLVGFSEDGSLLSELFTREGCGTLILKNGNEVIRQATIEDVGGILDLIQPLEESGALVKRSRELLETEISRFYVTVHPEGMIIGCAALYPFAEEAAGELACVATHRDFCNQGLAGRLLDYLEEKARTEFQLSQLFVLTTQAAHWFQENGFSACKLEQLPAEKAELYNFQRNAKIFVKQL